MKKKEFEKLLNEKHASNNPIKMEENMRKRMGFWPKFALIGTPILAATAVLAIVLPLTLKASPTTNNENNSSIIDSKITEPATPPKALNNVNKPFNSSSGANLSKKFKDGIRGFANDFARFTKSEENNVFSPMSIAAAFAMLYEGADGASKIELETLFHNGLLREDFQSLLLQDAISQDGEYVKYYLDIAQSFFVDNTFASRIYQTYVDTLTDYYYAEAYQGNLKSDEMHTLLADWINRKTKDFFHLTGDAFKDLEGVLWLANTVYLKTQWTSDHPDADPIAEDDPEAIFIDNKGAKQTSEFHNHTTSAYLGEDYDIFRIGLYGGMKFQVLLPHKGVNTGAIFENEETYKNLLGTPKERIANGMSADNETIHFLALPTFKNTAKFDLAKLFQQQGYTNIFDPDYANFSKIADTSERNLYVSDAIHEAGIDVNKDGIEAAAYTVIGLDEAMFVPKNDPIQHYANRPFLYAITDSSDMPLFVGTTNTLA